MIGALVEQEPNPNPGAFREALVSKTFLYSVDHAEPGRVWVLPVYRRQGSLSASRNISKPKRIDSVSTWFL
jgi:hypothetical protein